MVEIEKQLLEGFESIALLYEYAQSEVLLEVINDIQKAVKNGR